VPAEEPGDLPQAAVGEPVHRLRPAGPERALEEPARVEACGVHQMLHDGARHVADLVAAGEEPEAEVALLAHARPARARAEAEVEAADGEERVAADGEVEAARRVVPRARAQVGGLGAEVVGGEVGGEGGVPPGGEGAREAQPDAATGCRDARVLERREEGGEPAVARERVVVDEGDHLAARGAGAGVAGARGAGGGLMDDAELALGLERAEQLGRAVG